MGVLIVNIRSRQHRKRQEEMAGATICKFPRSKYLFKRIFLSIIGQHRTTWIRAEPMIEKKISFECVF